MKILADILNKIILFIILLLAFAAGYVFILRNFLSPPPIPATLPGAASNNTPLPQEQATNPNQTQTPIPTTSPSPKETTAVSPTPSAPSTTSGASSALPALALPNQVALNMPKKLTPGAVLSIYENVDNNLYPDPINYSPTSTKGIRSGGL